MPESARSVKLGYHFVHDEDLEAMQCALDDTFHVTRVRLPGNIGPRFYGAAFIEIALGVLAGGVGAVAFKKVLELIAEDLYKCAKRFAKAYMAHKKRHERTSIGNQLQITFEFAGVSCCAVVDVSAEADVIRALGAVDALIERGAQIVETRKVPEDTVLHTSDISGPVMSIDPSTRLPDLESVTLVFDPVESEWSVAEVRVRDGEWFKAKKGGQVYS